MFVISIVKVPLPKAPLDEIESSEPKKTASQKASSEEDALDRCLELINAGYVVEVTGPDSLHWDQEEVLRRLN